MLHVYTYNYTSIHTHTYLRLLIYWFSFIGISVGWNNAKIVWDNELGHNKNFVIYLCNINQPAIVSYILLFDRRNNKSVYSTLSEYIKNGCSFCVKIGVSFEFKHLNIIGSKIFFQLSILQYTYSIFFDYRINKFKIVFHVFYLYYGNI